MKQNLIDSIRERIEVEIQDRSALRFIKKLSVDDYVDTLIATVYLYTRARRNSKKSTVYLTELASALGHNLRNRYKIKRDSAIAAKIGSFLLYSFEELGIIRCTLGMGARGHNAYIVQVLEDEILSLLWESLDPNQVEKLPSEYPYADWQTSRHAEGALLVKTGNKDVLDEIGADSHPMVFECVNKAQRVGWRVNRFILDLQAWALRNKAEAFSDIWEANNAEARATKLREARAIAAIATKFIGKTFYHLYYLDFRGRKYPATAYLHEQSSDVARGLLLRADKKRIGKEGYFWLLVSIANNWAGDAGRDDGLKTDKIPLNDRAAWAEDNEEIFIAYVDNPKVNQGWMNADKPWQFMAACHELYSLRIYQGTLINEDPANGDDDDLMYAYESSLECFIDGSNNGSQHLAALTKDDVTAPHVNLVPLPLPGDLYAYVAAHVWEKIEATVATMSADEIRVCEEFIDNFIEIKKMIIASEPKSDRRKELVVYIQRFKEDNKILLNMAAPVYWARIKDMRQRRKIVKRGTMTIPYGSTAYGLGEQVINDARKHGIELLQYMEHSWGAYMGREIYVICKEALRRPTQLLSVFEAAGKAAEEKRQFLSWNVPITRFPVVQNYTEGKVRKIWCQYGPPLGEKLGTGYYVNTLQLAVCFIEDTKPSKGKQSQGAAPNIIHSLDAAHMMMISHYAPFPVTAIHDSFGCLLADMPILFRLVRETFVELYKTDPLTSIMRNIGGNLDAVEIGILDINLVKESEFCFS